ncbi:MAG: HAMP domain-containing sensor histidine kinase [Candidatus Caenarcaniphilales bacterium]|nr:HAMP domain-containing sensor histidine kinase [Candidatus Caenarcaniphilales bacterium]
MVIQLQNIEYLLAVLNSLKTGVVIFHKKNLLELNESAKNLLKVDNANIEKNDLGNYQASLIDLIQLDENLYTKQLTGEIGKPINATLHLIKDYQIVELSESFETKLGEASHEIRRPLTNVRTLVDTLHLWGAAEDPDARKKFLGQLHNEVHRLSKLVEELLNLSRIQAGSIPLNIQQLALKALVQETINMLLVQAEKKSVEIINDIPDNFVLIADIDKMTHVVQNLIENGIRYNKEGGKLTIKPVENNVSFLIQDTGKGIEEENVPHIFERFKRFNKEVPGTGLGLAIVKSIIDLHGGKIDVISKVGEGTQFIISIPPKKIVMPVGS